MFLLFLEGPLSEVSWYYTIIFISRNYLFHAGTEKLMIYVHSYTWSAIVLSCYLYRNKGSLWITNYLVNLPTFDLCADDD